jgi:hypothetical protein
MALRGHKSSRSSNAESITHFPSFLATRGNVWHDMECNKWENEKWIKMYPFYIQETRVPS